MSQITWMPIDNTIPIPEELAEIYPVYHKLVKHSPSLDGMQKESKELLSLAFSHLHNAMVKAASNDKPSRAAQHAKDLVSVIMKIDPPREPEDTKSLNETQQKQIDWIKDQRMKHSLPN